MEKVTLRLSNLYRCTINYLSFARNIIDEEMKRRDRLETKVKRKEYTSECREMMF